MLHELWELFIDSIEIILIVLSTIIVLLFVYDKYGRNL